jgi:hypothetical protein
MELKEIKRHTIAIIALIAMILIVFHGALDLTSIIPQDSVTAYHPRAEILKQSINRHNDYLPLWNPYMGGGQPYFSKPDVQGFFYIITILILALPTTLAALKTTYILNIILSSITMYALVYYLKKDRETAMIGAAIYALNGWVLSRFVYAHLTTLNAYALFPIIILFLIKSFREQKPARNALIAGILIGIQINVGPDLKVTLFTLIALCMYTIFQIFESPNLKQFKKTVIIISIIATVSFGLAAVKIFPTKEMMELSPREHLSYEQSASRVTSPIQFFTKLVEPIRTPKVQNETVSFHIGIIAFLLICFGVYKKWKNKMTIYLTLLIIIALLLASGSFLYYLLWKYIPPFDSFRYLDRTLVLYVFAASVLAAYGADALFSYLKDNKHLSEKKLKITKITIILLIFLNLGILGNSPYYGKEWNLQDALDNNHAYQHISKQPGIFRIHTFETRGIDWGTEAYSVPLGISNIYAYDGAWNTEYFNIFLGTAGMTPAKMWGILNVKYVTSTQPINVTGLEFVKKEKECEVCFTDIQDWSKSWGPYIYENKEALPRAGQYNSAILLIGPKTETNGITPTKQTAYALMLTESFDPKKTILIIKEEGTIDEMTQSEIERFDAIVLTQGSIGPNTNTLLKNYINNGGKVLPDILKGEQGITKEQVDALFNASDDNSIKIPDEKITWQDFDHQKITFDSPKQGWMLLSETYSIYPGWRAYADGEEVEIYKADGVITAVYLNKPTTEMIFEYKPRSFVIGSWIFILTLTALLAYFVSDYIKEMKDKKDN